MTTLNITLPDSLRAFVEEQAATGGFGSASDYVQTLLRLEQERHAEAATTSAADQLGLTEDELDAKLKEGLDSGPPVEADDAYWDRKRTDLLRRYLIASSPS